MIAQMFITFCHSLNLCNWQSEEVITKDLIIKSDSQKPIYSFPLFLNSKSDILKIHFHF